MYCPYCLSKVSKFIVNNVSRAYACPVCQSAIPRGYVELTDVPRANVGLVGFSGHGKTVFLTSLFSTLSKLSRYWEGYYYRSLDDYTHKILYEQVPLFDAGQLPDSTPANFPNPALIHYNNLPVYGDIFLDFYDTAGEVFSDSEQISRAGYFVAHSDVALFILSISDCDPDRLDDEMSRLLDTYISAVYDRLHVNLKERQRIVVVFTKADLLKDFLPDSLHEWLYKGEIDWYGLDLREKMIQLTYHSSKIAGWLSDRLKCNRFINMLNDHFLDVRYTLASATGPGGDPAKGEQPQPLRVMDPFFAIMHYARREQQQKKGGLANWIRQRLPFKRKD